MTRASTPALALLITLATGCVAYELPGAIGDQCDLNSDCDAPLVCRFGNCRVECDSARDCAAGFDCVFDNDQRGSCQLEGDLGCTLNSDCRGGLVCTMGECTNPCGCTDPAVPCPDCAPGAACVMNPDGTTSCLDTADDTCVYDSDCPGDATIPFEICAPDLRCRPACESDLDCRNGETCMSVTLDGSTGPLCVFTNPDAMPPSP